ncbi:TPA_exp: Conserved glycine-rich protein [Trichophyton benhamiae CBS 112371]|uniref:Conserved glycine-rich protein n=1 Tax=Arthroderma benhamiae (strain ATCC MYA-4681 / CBS 112371) TaxID=663331 RepID=D4AK36_ARTBC|nr:conserved glycine-rich protein [Trichophyton benhamiae CBS 112371]EFE37109.1 conserved glycine-rich protein [Trichophyton benhamiae CBS 112371]DAA79828.1 TPA_exp: Conserved glycine-rich protein [Trichophyton benhamiae CBS 112371]
MKFSVGFALSLLLLSSNVASRSILQTTDLATVRELEPPSVVEGPKHAVDLEKRKGGGGGGRGGGGGGRSGGGRSGGSGSGSGGRPRPGGGGAYPPRPANAGGTSPLGSGTPRSFGGFYGGGARVPFKAGGRSPLGRSPSFLPLAALAFFPGLWLFGVYAYYHSEPYIWYNRTSMRDQMLPVTCLCQQYSVCGCEDNNNNTYIDTLLDKSDPNNITSASPIVRVADANGTTSIFINGTLENGTTAPDDNPQTESMAPPRVLKISGYWLMAFMVFSAVLLL